MNIYVKTVIDSWGVAKTIQVIALTIASGAIAAFVSSVAIPSNPITIEKENDIYE